MAGGRFRAVVVTTGLTVFTFEFNFFRVLIVDGEVAGLGGEVEVRVGPVRIATLTGS